MHKRARRRATDGEIAVNPFKLVRHIERSGLDIRALAQRASVSPNLLRVLIRGRVADNRVPSRVDEFATVAREVLARIESILDCPGVLHAGQYDDFGTLDQAHFIGYRSTNRVARTRRQLPPRAHDRKKPRAVVFDFDGTLTRHDADRTTWERLWIELGYGANECGLLANRFFRKEITHDEWCQLTLERFRAKRLTEATVRRVGASIELIPGVAETIHTFAENGIPLYIVSGSIWTVISEALGPLVASFQSIEANVFSFDSSGVIDRIAGTKYDFTGKARFVRQLAKRLGVPTSSILFVGNSINDESVRSCRARTLLVNPHYTSPGNTDAWDDLIPHMANLSEILPFAGLAIPPMPALTAITSVDDTLFQVVTRLDRVETDEYTVVGGYKRFERDAREVLIAAKDRIRKSAQTKSSSRENYLICAAPGSGKTFFVEQIAATLEKDVRYISIDINKLHQDEILARFKEVREVKGNCLCLLDEIDGRAGEDWVYENIYKLLDLNMEPQRGATAFVLVGSSGGTIAKLTEAMKSRNKGRDLVDRIPQASGYSLSIPKFTLGDTVLVYAVTALKVARARNLNVRHVEKLAVYLAVRLFGDSSPRQLDTFVAQAVGRLASTEQVLRYDHHFERGDTTNQEFWTKNARAAQMLLGKLLDIS